MTSKKTPSKTGKASGFVIGSARFRKMSAVEGIHYSPDMKGCAAVAQSKAVTPEQRRKTIIEAYRKASLLVVVIDVSDHTLRRAEPIIFRPDKECDRSTRDPIGEMGGQRQSSLTLLLERNQRN